MREHEWKFGDFGTREADGVVVGFVKYNETNPKYGFFIKRGDVQAFSHSISVVTYQADCTGFDWQPPKQPPEVGECYRFIDIMKDVPKHGDEFWSEHEQKWIVRPFGIAFDGIRNNQLTPYRRKIEPPYRPFANAEEFKPHRDKWIKFKGGSGVSRAFGYTNDTVRCREDWTFEQAFESLEFEDGTPFGVKLQPKQSLAGVARNNSGCISSGKVGCG